MKKLEREIRAIEEAEYYIKNKTTIRETAKHFGVSKSTVHLDLTKRLKNINLDLYNKSLELMKSNKEIRNVRGGEATKLLHMRRRLEETNA